MATPPRGFWECPRCGGFNEEHSKKCIDCGYDDSKMDWSTKLNRTIPQSNSVREEVDESLLRGNIETYPPTINVEGGLVDFFRIVAVVIWVGGAIVSFFFGRTETYNRYGYSEYEYNIPMMLASIAAFLVSGGLFMAVGEIIKYLRIIANNTSKLKITLKNSLVDQKD